MIVEINFLEQKKKNNLPLWAVGILVVLLLAVVAVLFIQKNNQENSMQMMERQLQANSEKQEKAENEKNMQQSRLVLERNLSVVEAGLFPALPLMDRMIALLPEHAYFNNYAYENGMGLNIEVRVADMDQAAAYTNALEKENYIQMVDLTRVSEVSMEEDKQYLASFYIQIDEQLWMEAVANEG